ncbi:ECF-type riboflavin transporter substrate-binding protein [Saccharibacillus sp. JS10]|uniref:ECF-type riboflavin transporter substrate-binding protein n=1 Tax=Saccharibacillus sp. JS10 TaxID=2950552 RepID=UPI00210A6B4A|nr:ECF-type riboflavin transporter substrate-binding protein [Saccharibacillus sp. JS10]MCQ4085704.1 ECF-type riboflavin transporter substrate-binding protein [Saccharibacillus sp. JS10]
MQSKSFSVKTVVAIGIGAALFVVLARFGSIPSPIPNTNIQTNYAILALFAVLYGPLAGLLIGLIGHTVTDLISYGNPWFSWIIASGVFGLIVGLLARKLRIQKGQYSLIRIQDGEFGLKGIVLFNIIQIIANVLSWLVVAPVLDILIYAEPANKVFTQGVLATGANIATVAVLGTLIAIAYSKTRTKQGSLTREE